MNDLPATTPVNLEQWQTYLESLDPSRIELGLDRVRAVFQRLHLDITSRVVVVAGTNGKGSTVAALQALLIAQNLSVGSYVSPHLQRFNERVCFQGQPVSDEDLIDAFAKVGEVRADIALTYFEFTTLAAIQLLSNKQPDYLVFEVGLGGRLDAVNILDADIAIVTGVALDHMDWLGPDVESIGYEKAGVYRSGKPAIYASPECPDSVKRHIEEIGAVPYILGETLMVSSEQAAEQLRICLNEQTHQLNLSAQNLPQASLVSALAAFLLLGFDPDVGAPPSEVLSSVVLPGRYQRVKVGDTTCILDVAHNPQAAEFLAERLLDEEQFKQPVAIVGTMSDKNLLEIFQPLVKVIDQWFLVRPDIPRAASLAQQRQALLELGVSTTRIQDVGAISNLDDYLSGIKAAVVFGSFYTVGEFLNRLE